MKLIAAVSGVLVLVSACGQPSTPASEPGALRIAGNYPGLTERHNACAS